MKNTAVVMATKREQDMLVALRGLTLAVGSLPKDAAQEVHDAYSAAINLLEEIEAE